MPEKPASGGTARGRPGLKGQAGPLVSEGANQRLLATIEVLGSMSRAQREGQAHSVPQGQAKVAQDWREKGQSDLLEVLI